MRTAARSWAEMPPSCSGSSRSVYGGLVAIAVPIVFAVIALAVAIPAMIVLAAAAVALPVA